MPKYSTSEKTTFGDHPLGNKLPSYYSETHLYEQFPSTSAKAGRSSRAGLKLQISFNWLNGQMAHLTHQSANKSDLGYHLKSEWYKPNSLVLFDLGYFVLNSLAEFNRKGIWWLSRLDLKCNLFDPTSLEMLSLSSHFTPQLAQQGYVDQPVLVGDTARLPARLVMVALPHFIAEGWRRRANQQAQKRGYQADQKQREWLSYNAYLTNLSASEFEVQQIYLLYRVRWQIEVLFKLAKSQAALDESRASTTAGVLVPIYAKLLGLAVFAYLGVGLGVGAGAGRPPTPISTEPPLLDLDHPPGCAHFELSWPKAWQTLSRRAIPLAQAIQAGPASLEAFLADLQSRFEHWCAKTHQPSRLTTTQQLQHQLVQFQTRRPLSAQEP